MIKNTIDAEQKSTNSPNKLSIKLYSKAYFRPILSANHPNIRNPMAKPATAEI